MILSLQNLKIDLGINDMYEQRIALMSTSLIIDKSSNTQYHSVVFLIKNFALSPGSYNCTLFSTVNEEIADWVSNIMQFNVIEKDYYKTGKIIVSNMSKTLLNYSSALL